MSGILCANFLRKDKVHRTRNSQVVGTAIQLGKESEWGLDWITPPLDPHCMP